MEIPGEIAPELKKIQFKDTLSLSACRPNHGVFGVSRCFASAKRPGHDSPSDHWDPHCAGATVYLCSGPVGLKSYEAPTVKPLGLRS